MNHLRRMFAPLIIALTVLYVIPVSAVEFEEWAVRPSFTLVLDGIVDAKRSDNMLIGAHYAQKYGAVFGYAGVGAAVETERLGLWSGGTAYASVETFRSRLPSKSLPPRVFQASNIHTDNFVQLSELWYEQRLFDERVRVIVGRQYGESEFGFIDVADDFFGEAFPLNPTIFTSAYPDPALGVTIVTTPLPWLQVGGGVWAPPDEDYVGLVEVALSTDALRVGETVAKAGYWRHESAIEYLVDASAAPHEAPCNWGFYGSLEQAVPFPVMESATLFAQIGVTPEARNEIARFYSGGIVFAGLTERFRPDDTVGFSIAHAIEGGQLRDDLIPTETETHYEGYWQFVATDWLSFTANMCYATRSAAWAMCGVAPSPSSQLTAGLRMTLEW